MNSLGEERLGPQSRQLLEPQPAPQGLGAVSSCLPRGVKWGPGTEARALSPFIGHCSNPGGPSLFFYKRRCLQLFHSSEQGGRLPWGNPCSLLFSPVKVEKKRALVFAGERGFRPPLCSGAPEKLSGRIINEVRYVMAADREKCPVHEGCRTQ